MAVLIFGCGYLGLRAARLWQARGEIVYAVTRSSRRGEALRREGLQPLVADVTDPESLRHLPTADAVLYAVGHDRQAGPSLHAVYVDGLGNVLDRLRLPANGRLIYVSSTGVYGQQDGSEVDEGSPCQPTRAGGRACLAAEGLLSQHRLGNQAITLRMAGIYGPGRIPRSADLLAGNSIAAAADGYLNLIHVDDAANIVLAAADQARPPRLYLVADGEPVRRRDYFAEMARLVGAPSPRFDDAPSASGRDGSKRAKVSRLRAEITHSLHYPSYRQGLAAIVAAVGQAF